MATQMRQIGRYEVERELGRGAMGVVYLARDTRIGRSVALKTIRLSDFADAEKLQRLRERLVREAQSAGILSHENIVTIYDVDEQDGLSYISMEFVEGESLERMLDRRRELSREMMLSLLRQMADALDFAHSRGIVHRDIKPPNIMVTPLGRAKITDFGVAKLAHASSMTQGGAMLGTPDYMSPEQIAGSGVDGRSDQFSLGVIAFELLSGEKPFVAETLPALFYRIAHEPSPDATLLNRSLSAEIGKVLERAMAKSAMDRFDSCSSFVDALAEACAASPGWHPLPRGMSQTLPTLGDAARAARKTTEDSDRDETATGGYPTPSAIPPKSAAPAGPAVSAPKPPSSGPPAPANPPVLPPRVAPEEPEPVWVPTLPPPRVTLHTQSGEERTASGYTGSGAGGFITGVDSSQSETLEFAKPPQPDWLRDAEEEGRQQTRSKRRGWIAALLSLLVVGGALAAVYFGLGGIQVPGFSSRPIPETTPELVTDERPSATGDPGTSAETGSAGVESAGLAGNESNPNTVENASTDAGADTTATGNEDSSTPDPEPEKPAAKPEPETVPPPRPAPAKTKGPERPAARMGQVRFMSDPPGAEVTVDADSRYRCETPCSLDLPVGRHTYSLRLAGYQNEIKLIELGETGATVSARMQRRVGMVRVTSTPSGATVLVNGERQSGVTPLSLRLLPGNYRLMIEKDGRRLERNITVSEDTAVQIEATLQ